ncbi:MAG: DUF1080 domain-containing protein [Pirellulales bacterium]
MSGISASFLHADEPTKLPAATINGEGPDWKTWTLDDFENVNGADDTWSMKDGVIHCTGKPVSVTRSKIKVTNFELSTEWRHLKPAGNSGIFVWTTPESLEKLGKKSGLPHGIEVQVLDTGYAAQYEKSSGKKGDWFTSHGDVFPVGVKMKPFPPTSPNGQRSFPKKDLVKDSPEWNHYYVRGINGEVRLWVNGEEVSGGTNIEPRTGYLCLESEGSPVEFKNFKFRELP